jgi:hypothetical protein
MAKGQHIGHTPDWMRKAAIASALEALLRDPDAYLTAEFGLQPHPEHILDMADRLFRLSTEDAPETPPEQIFDFHDADGIEP